MAGLTRVAVVRRLGRDGLHCIKQLQVERTCETCDLGTCLGKEVGQRLVGGDLCIEFGADLNRENTILLFDEDDVS